MLRRKKKGTIENLILFYQFYEIPENSNHVTKFLGKEPRFYCREFSDTGIR